MASCAPQNEFGDAKRATARYFLPGYCPRPLGLGKASRQSLLRLWRCQRRYLGSRKDPGWEADKAAINGQCLAVDIRLAVTQQKTSSIDDFTGLAITFCRIDLANAVFLATFSREIEGRFGHASFNKAWADCVYSHASAVELICGGLNDADNASLTGGIIHAACICAQVA